MVLTFGVRHGDTQRMAVRRLEGDDTVQHKGAVVCVHVRSYRTEVCDLACRGAVFRDGYLNKTATAGFLGPKEIEGVRIGCTDRLFEFGASFVTPGITSGVLTGLLTVQRYPCRTVPLEPSV